MDPQGLNHLESLPAEIYCQILEELLALHKNDRAITQLSSTPSLPRYVFHPTIQPQVLRVSRTMHTLGKSVLNHCNQWIVIDMDYAYVLTCWASAFLEMIVVDPESAQDLPSGMMHIRVKPFVKASGLANISSQIGRSGTIDRQIILIPARQLDKFISALRMTELANVPRVIQGKLFRNRYTNEEYHVQRGEHGLSILIHVNEGYPRPTIKSCLELFRKFHGPLNEVSIVGALDEQQARSIETSIPLPRDSASESNFSEVVMHILDLIAMAEAKVEEGMDACVPKLYEQTRLMIMNTHNNDKTPWSGWITNSTAKDEKFEMIVLCASFTNLMVRHMLTHGAWTFPTPTQAYARHMSPDVQWLLQQTGLVPQLSAWVYLLNGLHCILSSNVGGSRDIHLGVVYHGLRLIEESKRFAYRMPLDKTGLFEVAYQMGRLIRRLGPNFLRDPTHICSFAKWFSANLKPVKWRVHESHIPQKLLNKGVLSKMKNESLLTSRELDKYLVVDTLVVEPGAQGDFYLI